MIVMFLQPHLATGVLVKSKWRVGVNQGCILMKDKGVEV